MSLMTMQQLQMFNNKTIGREKLARLLQYASKLTWNVLMKMKSDGSLTTDRIKHLEYVLGNFRRLLRMGRCVDTLYIALRMIQHDDSLIRFDCGLSKVSFAGFLLCDHVIWLGRNQFLDADVDWWNRSANRFWLMSIVFNLIRDYFEIKRRLSNQRELQGGSGDPQTFLENFAQFAEKHKDVVVDTVKNGCDLFIPLAALNHIRLSPIIVGLLGVISSVAGIYGVVDPFAKLPLS